MIHPIRKHEYAIPKAKKSEEGSKRTNLGFFLLYRLAFPVKKCSVLPYPVYAKKMERFAFEISFSGCAREPGYGRRGE